MLQQINLLINVQLNQTIESLKNNFLNLIVGFPQISSATEFLQYIGIPFLALVIVIFIFLLLFNRFGYERKIIYKNEIDLKINDFLTEIIFSGFSTNEVKERVAIFKKEVPFKKKWCKSVILNKIITLKRNINGVNPHQMLLIYKYFGFHEYSDKLIKSSSWEKKLLGIYHYQVLEYKIKTGHIRPNIYVKNKYLKSNALIAVLSLSDQKFDFLTTYQKPISYADELKILDIIHQKKSALPVKINDWLNNKNSSIVVLGIKLIIRYRGTITEEQITKLLDNKNHKVRRETYMLIRNLYLLEATNLIMEKYYLETEKRNKISALKTLAQIGDEDTKHFAVALLKIEDDIDIKFEIIHCIYSIDPVFFDQYLYESKEEENIIKRIILHLKTPELN